MKLFLLPYSMQCFNNISSVEICNGFGNTISKEAIKSTKFIDIRFKISSYQHQILQIL